MKNVKFTIEKRKDSEENGIITNLPIRVDFSFDSYKRFEYYTGLKVDLKYWDDGMARDEDGNLINKKRIHEGRVKRTHPNSVDLNNKLSGLKTEIVRLYETANILKTPLTLEYFRNGVKKFQNRLDSTERNNIFEYYDMYIESMDGIHAKNSVKKYKSTLIHLKKFCKNKTNISFYDTGYNFLERLHNYLTKKAGKNENGLGFNTVIKYMKSFKAFLKWADLNGFNKNLDFYKYKIESELIPKIVSLKMEEIMKIYNYYLEDEYLIRVRDIFCFACFTGQRYGEIVELKKYHIKDGIWNNKSFKTKHNKEVNIPLNKFALELLRKYENHGSDNCFPTISNQNMNDYLKILGEKMEMFDTVVQYYYKGAERIEEKKMMFELMTTKIGRKSMASNLAELNVDSKTAISITGHKTEKVFNQRYAEKRITSSIAAMKLMEDKLAESEQ